MKMTLADLAKNQKWIPSAHHGKSKVSEDDICIKINKKTTQSKIINTIVIKIGINVAKKLLVARGEKIHVFHHPDDLLSFMIVKSISGSGYKLYREANNTRILKTMFLWRQPVVLEEMPTTKIDYLHLPEKNSIVFRIENK